MGRSDVGFDLNSDDPDDLEIGASCWSKTHFGAHNAPRGGTIIGLNLDNDNSVLSVVAMEQHAGWLDTFEIVRSDIDMGTVEYFGRNAKVAAEIVNRWLGSKSGPRDAHLRLRWQRTALDLQEAGTGGPLLPKAELRHRRVRDAS